MNKRNKIMVVCLALLLTLSIGYALFSETITINGTATAKGSFDITPSCQIGMPSSIATLLKDDENIMFEPYEGATENDSCDVEGSKITINTEMLYPSANRFFAVEMKNTGTMDAVIGVEEIDAGTSINLYKKSDNSFYKTLSEVETTNYGSLELSWVFIKLTDGTLIYKDNDLMNNKTPLITGEVPYLRIKPNESFILMFTAYWDEYAIQTEYYSKAQMSTELPFKQVTSDMVDWELDGFCLNAC